MMKKAVALAIMCALTLNALAQSKMNKPALHPASVRTGVKRSAYSSPTKKVKPFNESLYTYDKSGWIKYSGDVHSLGEFYKKLGINGRTYVTTPDCGVKGKKNGCQVMIGYKLFTNEPQWALMNDTLGLHRYVSGFDIEKVIASRIFEFEVSLEIKEHTIDSAFILETLGLPDRKRGDFISNESDNEIWDYDRYSLAFTLKKGIVISCIKLEE